MRNRFCSALHLYTQKEKNMAVIHSIHTVSTLDTEGTKEVIPNRCLVKTSPNRLIPSQESIMLWGSVIIISLSTVISALVSHPQYTNRAAAPEKSAPALFLLMKEPNSAVSRQSPLKNLKMAVFFPSAPCLPISPAFF